jgi:LEA14-like dessication related protein
MSQLFKKPTLLLFLVIGLLYASCRSPKSPEFISYDGLKIEKAGFKSSTIKANLHFHNPNNWGLLLEKTDLDVYINETFLGHSSQNLGLKIPKKGPFTLPLAVEIDMKNLLKNTVSSLLNKRVTIRVKGKITAGKGKISFTFPVDFTTEQELSLF